MCIVDLSLTETESQGHILKQQIKTYNFQNVKHLTWWKKY